MLERYTDVHAFYRDVAPFLSEREVENNLPLGILAKGVAQEDANAWWMASQGEGKGRLVSLQTPPHNLLLSGDTDSIPDDTLLELVCELGEHGFAPMGVNAEKVLARRFAALYTNELALTMRVHHELRIYKLTRVEDVPLIGVVREATEEDIFFAPYWMYAMAVECDMGQSFEQRLGVVRHWLDPAYPSRGYVLEAEGMPVSVAGLGRVLPHGRAVGNVYTPPFFRGKGYATSCVAQVSRIALEAGNEYCTLFTDLSNPVSNSIYQKIGYRPISDVSDLRFAKA